MRIALEGGGCRAAFSAGILHTLLKEGVAADAIVGSSSGSMNAACYAASNPDALKEMWANVETVRRIIDYGRFVNPFGGPGLDVDDLVYRFLRDEGHLDSVAATSAGTALYVTATNIDTMQADVLRPDADTLWDALRASMALPVAYNRVAEFQGSRYVDGGVASPIPFDVQLDEDVAGPSVAIITRRVDTPKPRPSWWQRALIRTIVPREVREVTLVQHEHHNATVKRLWEAHSHGDVIVVQPPHDMPVSRLTRDGDKLSAGFAMGQRCGEELVDELARR